MRRRVAYLLLLCIVCALFVTGCGQKPISSSVPETTPSATTTVPPVTTTAPPTTSQPPETEAPYVPAEIQLDPEVYYIDTRFWYKSEGECPEGYYQLGDEGWEEVASHMTTQALIETVFAYPDMLRLEAASQTWFLLLLDRRIGIVEELLSREDLEWALYTYPVDFSKAYENGELVDLNLAMQRTWFERLKMYVYGAEYLWDPNAEFKRVDVPW